MLHHESGAEHRASSISTKHLAENVAAQKHRIVFGGVTASLVIGLAMQDTGEQALEEVGLDKVRFRVSVIHGDTLYAFTRSRRKGRRARRSPRASAMSGSCISAIGA